MVGRYERNAAMIVFPATAESVSRWSMVGLLSVEGMEAFTTQEGSLKGAHFEAFIEASVVPTLEPGDVVGDVVVVDNARCHQGKRVRELIEAVGAEVLFLPTYSPDFAPIELAWRPIKAHLRRVKARTPEELSVAIEIAWQLVTAQQAKSYFAHCGYKDSRKKDEPDSTVNSAQTQ